MQPQLHVFHDNHSTCIYANKLDVGQVSRGDIPTTQTRPMIRHFLLEFSFLVFLDRTEQMVNYDNKTN